MILQHALATPVLDTTGSGPQLEFGNGFSLRGNARFSENDTDSHLGDSIRAGLAVLYLPQGIAGFRPLVEIGGWTEPNAAFRFQREYANGVGLALGEGFATGSISNTYARAGVVWEATTTNQ